LPAPKLIKILPSKPTIHHPFCCCRICMVVLSKAGRTEPKFCQNIRTSEHQDTETGGDRRRKSITRKGRQPDTASSRPLRIRAHRLCGKKHLHYTPTLILNSPCLLYLCKEEPYSYLKWKRALIGTFKVISILIWR
jgi:hypothetical protein